MKYKKRTYQVIDILRKENIQTWFDLGLFLDRIREEADRAEPNYRGSYESFLATEIGGGVAFITFHYMVDGVTVEIGKYAELISRTVPGIPIHYIGGKFKSKSENLIKPHYKKFEIEEISGFGDWKLYNKFFLTELERGSKPYNELILEIWNECLVIIERLGNYIEQEGIGLLYIVNVCSNPGNVSAALAAVLLSEFMGIPVVNNNHDFYWEGGHSKYERKNKGVKSGPRDFFFTNAHIGEVFSIVEMLYPWESKRWVNVNINLGQSAYLIRNKGHNPARVLEIGTAVDTDEYTKIDKRRKINAFLQFEKMLSRYKNQLVGYSVEDVLTMDLVSEKMPRPILIGSKTRPVNTFISENIIFLQPTRIISRKRIELGFRLLRKLLSSDEMKDRLDYTPKLKITLLITGPIASGHFDYYRNLVDHFRELLSEIPASYKDRVFLAFLFGELDKESFQKEFENPVGIPELYNIASLILLPSETEGRGLPIIEATACGTPIFCSRYTPDEVYSEVIGEHLKEKERLKVLEFKQEKISSKIVSKIVERVFYPHNFAHETKHNKRVVERRYSLDSLQENIRKILSSLYNQQLSHSGLKKITKEALEEYSRRVNFRNDDLEFLIHRKSRHYMPGYGQLHFMLMLKSLIDPSFFRNEQQKVRGMVFYFSKKLIRNVTDRSTIQDKNIADFYNAVDSMFKIKDGEVAVRHDHSMAYRHRNRNNYPYQQFTFQELTGIINLLYLKFIKCAPQNKVDLSPQFFTDWNLALQQLSSSKYLAIDDRELLIDKLHQNLPIAYFPGEYITYELEFFALQSIRSRLKLPIEEEVTSRHLENHHESIAPVYIFAQQNNLGKQLSKEEIHKYIAEGESLEIRLLYDHGLIKIVNTNQLCVGIHFPQLGEEALRILRKIREEGGYLLTNRRNAAMMTDIVNIERFHIGQVKSEHAANIMGIPLGSGYIQYVPAGIRTTLAYPTPIQTSKDFHDALQGDLYNSLVAKLGKEAVIEAIQRDAEKRGSPVMHVLENLLNENIKKLPVTFEYVSGIYDDTMPYNGVIGKLNIQTDEWRFKAITTQNKPKTVSAFVEEFEIETNHKAHIAWNGGYILNAELVGKLGLSESYIGSPLGMLITDGKCESPPLFNKAALLVHRNGKVNIDRVNCARGITISGSDWSIEMGEECYNLKRPGKGSAYYDLMSEKNTIKGDGRTIVRFSGNRIIEVIKTAKGQNAEIIPVGLTVSIAPGTLPEGIRVNEEINFLIHGFEDIIHAIEAGPMLLNDGQLAIDMDIEGWKTKNSIATQAARLDYTDMRGPKIAVGINNKGEMAVLTINGRIRESVGATHFDMATILKRYGMKSAMGFDPGGSSTLVINGRTMNISPYNHRYEENIYSLPPEPRAVSNAVIGYILN